MSDEESFVILGSTPTPSMEAYSSLDSPSIQLVSQPNTASYISNKDADDNLQHVSKTSSSLLSLQQSQSGTRSNSAPTSFKGESRNNQECKIQSAPLAMDSTVSSTFPEGIKMTNSAFTRSLCMEESLAHKYLMGEVDGNIMKQYISQQFPSLWSKDSKQDDIDKLQQLIIDHDIYKNQLQKMNKKLEELIEIVEIGNKTAQLKYEQAIDQLRQENATLRKELDDRFTLVQLNEENMQKEHLELIKKISAEKSVLNNMSAQIEKLELQHHDMSLLNINEPNNHQTNYLTAQNESNLNSRVKDLERQLSAVHAKNLEFEDMRKIYLDEINCLKVNLTAAEELLLKAQSDIQVLQKNDIAKNELFTQYEADKNKMRNEIDILKHQLEVYRSDFEIERNARQELAGQKDQLLTDLKLLQRRNQQLLEESEKRSRNNPSSSASAAAEHAPPTSNFSCPICNKVFQTLAPLQVHASTCST